MGPNHDAVFLIQGDEMLVLSRTPYELEDDFQAQLATHPQLLGGGQFPGTSERRWLLVDREVPVPDSPEGGGRWSLDHLFIDQDAVPTLVEVKRGTDTRMRRETVGQMLDYAANGPRYWPAELLRGRWEASLEDGQSPDEVIQEFARLDAEDFWTRVSENLRDGRVRLLLVSDNIPTEVQTVIEYLNEQMSSAEVLGVSISRYAREEVSVLVPRVLGATVRSQQSKRSQAGLSYEEYLEEVGEDARAVEEKLMRLAESHDLPVRRTPKALQLRTHSGDREILQFYPGYKLQLSLDPLRGMGFGELADEILRRATMVTADPLTDKYPGIPFRDALEHWDTIEEIALILAEPGSH